MKNNPKSQLSWNLSDYLTRNEEPPPRVLEGRTEGEVMELDEIELWIRDNIRFLTVFRDEYSHKFEEQYQNYRLDLEYLCEIGKITIKQKDNLLDKEIFNSGR